MYALIYRLIIFKDSVMSLPLDELDGDNVAESDVNPETVS